MRRFKVYFYFKGKCKTLLTDIGVQEILSGFWVSEDLELTLTSVHRYFIPPTQVRLIELMDQEKN